MKESERKERVVELIIRTSTSSLSILIVIITVLLGLQNSGLEIPLKEIMIPLITVSMSLFFYCIFWGIMYIENPKRGYKILTWAWFVAFLILILFIFIGIVNYMGY